MHPDEMKTKTPGQLILRTPEGLEMPLTYTMAEIQADVTDKDPDDMSPICTTWTAPEITIDLAPDPGFHEWLAGMVNAYKAWLEGAKQRIVDDMVAWAKENRPDWLRIFRRTKKSRTRKKYANRILRAYMEHLKAGG